MRFAVYTLGCRLNQFETDAMGRRLQAAGHELVHDVSHAEFFLINSCSITQEADSDTRQLVRRLRRENPDIRVVVTGCYATAAPNQVAALDGVALVVRNGEKNAILEHIRNLQHAPPHSVTTTAEATSHSPAPAECGEAASRASGMGFELSPAIPLTRQRAYLKIQDGCDYRCSFCIVPSVRGDSRSISMARLLQQLDALVASGTPEVVLTGVHLGTYGRDLKPRIHFTDLIEAMLPRLGAARLRLGSLDPHEVDDRLLNLMSSNATQLCRYLHLPVQSGDDGILRLMRRAHSAADLTTVVRRAHDAIPGIAIGSDIIVGFPQETAAAFDNTVDTLSRLPLAYLHVFRYSPRQGTQAALLRGHVPPPIKLERSKVLRELSTLKRRAFVSRHVGEQLWGVVIKKQARTAPSLPAPEEADGRVGLQVLTDNYIRVDVRGPADAVGHAVQVRVNSATHEGHARGELIRPNDNDNDNDNTRAQDAAIAIGRQGSPRSRASSLNLRAHIEAMENGQ